MKGFVVYSSYRIEGLGPKILLYGRLENGQSFITINAYEPYFFIKESDVKKADVILKEHSVIKTDFKNFNNEKAVKVIVDIPSTVPILRKELEEKGIECYEADIKFAYRYMIDKDIKGSINIEGDYETSDYVDRIYYEPEITSAEFVPKLKIFSIDIETSPDNKKLYSIAIYSENSKKVFLMSDKKIKDFLTFKDEYYLLEEFRKTILEEDPDIITGWSVVDFDLSILKDKFNEHEIPFILGRENKLCKVKKEKDFFRKSRADFPGRMVLDGIDLLKDSFIKLDNYKLSTAAAKFLGDSKNIKDNEKVEQIEKFFANDKEKLAEYNLKDAELVYRILEKSNVINLSIKRSLLTGMPLDRVGASIASIDSLYIRETKKLNYVVKTAEFADKKKQITGGYVMESIPGIYDNLIVLDFKSLYPSIIRTFGIDPFLFVGKKKGKNLVIAPNKAAFRNEEGILPRIIENLMKERKKAINNKDELTSYAIKIHLNSIFGVLANPTYRFFNLDIANAITTFGQFIIKLTAKKIEEFRYEVIYQDTDSSLIALNVNSVKEAEKIGLELQDKINSFFKDYIKKEYKKESYLALEFKKAYVKFLMPKIRHSERGAKKRYAGLYIDSSGKEKLEFVGLETVRCICPLETNVILQNELKSLNSIKLHESLFTMDLETRDISLTNPINFFEYNYSGEILDLEIEGGQRLYVTPNHSFFSLIPSNKQSRLDRGFCRYKGGKILIKEASQLEKGDYLITLEKIGIRSKTYDKSNILDLARFFGYFVGEGRLYERYSKRGLHQRRITFAFDLDEKEIIEDCKSLCIKIFGKNPHSYFRKNSRCHVLYFDLDRKLFLKIKEHLVFNKVNNYYSCTWAFTHKIPDFILNGDKKTVGGFLQAYFDAEGTVGRELSCTTTSKPLFIGVQYLLRKVGIQYSICICKPNQKYRRTRIAYQIIIGLNGFEKFTKYIGFKLKYKQDRLFTELRCRNLKRARYIRYLTECIGLRKIKRITRRQYLGKVYDIEVDSPNKNYFVNYVLVHNSDWTDLAKKFQYEIIDRVFHKEDIIDFIKDFVKKVYLGEYDNFLIYRKSIRKGLGEYVKITPQHVKAARKLQKLTSNLIEYVMTENGPEPIQNKKSKIDYDYYVQKQLKPIADSVLVFFNKNFDEVIRGSRQTTLSKF